MVLITACAGVSSAQNLSGTLASVDAQHHSIMLNASGHSYTINGLTDQEVAALQAEEGKISSVSIQATQNSDGSYTIVSGQNSLTFTFTTGTSITVVGNGTPVTSSTPGASGIVGSSGTVEPGSISFTGMVQSVNSTSIVVNLPDGSTLPMTMVNGQTDLSKFNGSLPSVGQLIKVDATANTDGSFVASKLSPSDSGDLKDQNTVDYQGVTTQAVGTDNVIHFRIGNRDFSFTIFPGATKLDDFDNNVQSIGSNMSVKVTVRFQGATGNVQEVKKP